MEINITGTHPHRSVTVFPKKGGTKKFSEVAGTACHQCGIKVGSPLCKEMGCVPNPIENPDRTPKTHWIAD